MKELTITFKSVICDAPAKAFVKSIKLCSGYFGCDKCYQGGVVYLGQEGGVQGYAFQCLYG